MSHIGQSSEGLYLWNGTRLVPFTSPTTTIVRSAGALTAPSDPGPNSKDTYVLTFAGGRVVNLPATPSDGSQITVKEGANSAAAIAIQLLDASASIEGTVNGSTNIASALSAKTLQYEAANNAWWVI